MTKLRGLFLFPAKNRLDQMKQIFGKSKVANRANCNLRTLRAATLRAGLICNLRTRQIATLAASAKAARFGALLVLHNPKKSTFGSRYTKPKGAPIVARLFVFVGRRSRRSLVRGLPRRGTVCGFAERQNAGIRLDSGKQTVCKAERFARFRILLPLPISSPNLSTKEN